MKIIKGKKKVIKTVEFGFDRDPKVQSKPNVMLLKSEIVYLDFESSTCSIYLSITHVTVKLCSVKL